MSLAHIEEANEVVVKGKSLLLSRIGRWTDNGVPPMIIMTCNPSQGWVRDDFRELSVNGTLKSNRLFIESDVSELEPEFHEILKNLPPAEYSRYVENNWDYSDDPNQLIKYEWIKDSLCEPQSEVSHIGVDVAREGNDRTVFMYRNGESAHSLEEFSQQDTIATAQLIIERMKEKGVSAQDVSVDVIGVGGGVVDYLASQRYGVNAYNSGHKADESFSNLSFKNKRACDYWNLREKLQAGEIKIPDNQELIKELTNIRYFVKDKIIQIESKQDIKKRLTKSPDLADALVIAFNEPEEFIFNV